MKRFAWIVIATFWVLSANAQAAPAIPEVEAYYAAGLVYWNQPAPPQCATVTLEMQPTDPYGEGAAARATQPREGETEVHCVISVYEDLWAHISPCGKEMVIRHEIGHTLGLGHNLTDSADIMAPDVDLGVWCHEFLPAPAPAPAAPVVVPATADYGTAAEFKAYNKWVRKSGRCAQLMVAQGYYDGHIRSDRQRRRLRACWARARHAYELVPAT